MSKEHRVCEGHTARAIGRAWRTGLVVALLAGGVYGQVPQGREVQQTAAQLNTVRPDYVLGANDQIFVRTPQVPEMTDRPFRIDGEGFVELPMVGRIHAAGMTIQAFETDLMDKLKEYVRSPQVFVTLAQLRGDPVFLVGAFRSPGIYPLTGRKTLVEVLTSAGGILPNASRRIRLTRRADYGELPLPNAVENKEKRISVVEISLESLSQNINPEEDIVLQPYDIISAEQAERVYVSGEVIKSASIELGERKSISIAQALTEAGGMTPAAKRDQVRVLRAITGTDRRAEIIVNAELVFGGKARDFPLLPNDVVYVPGSFGRKVMSQTPVQVLGSLPYLLSTILIGVLR